MCDLCEPDISQIDKKVFEPTCGNGNFLVEILQRKLSQIKIPKNTKKIAEEFDISAFEFDILIALSNIYAVDIQQDNVIEARKRMHDIILDHVSKSKSSFSFLGAVDNILETNIIRGNTLTMKKTLLFIDFQPQYQTRSFVLTKYSMKDLEEIADRTEPSNATDLNQAISRLKSPPKKASSKKNKRVRKTASTLVQPALFKEIS